MNRHIQTLRGLACVMLVLYHVIGTDPWHGLRVTDGPVRWFNDGLAYLRMPLFTVLSGLVYGMRPFLTGDDSSRFLIGKVRRLLLPMLVVGTIFALLQAVNPGSNESVPNWLLLHIEPVAHFWYLEALLWVFLLVWALERNDCLRRARDYLLVFVASVALYLTVPGPRLLAIQGAIYLLPYFLSGLAVTRFGLWSKLRHPGLLAALLLLACLAAWQIGLPAFYPNRRAAWFLLAGLSLCGLCLSLRIEWPWLARLGSASYSIYLFHVFFTASSRIALDASGLGMTPVQISIGLLCGLTGPLLVDRYASRSPWLALLLLGKSLRKRPSRVAAGSAALTLPGPLDVTRTGA